MYKKKNFILMCFLVLCLTLLDFSTAKVQAAGEEIDNSAVTEEEQSVYEDDFSKYLTGAGVTLLGDSIMNGNRKIILAELPDAYIDAKGSRDVCGGFEAATKLEAEGKLTDVVIVELGTNGPLLKHEPYATGTQNLLELLGTERQIFWVTVYCSYSQWMAMNNDYIWELAATRPNIIVIDWYSLAVQHPEWFPDGVHPNLEGARNFAKLLRDSLELKYGSVS